MIGRRRPMESLKAGRAATDRRRFSAACDEAGDLNECTSASCRSCTAVLLADCIALSCCPCAVVSLLALALVKVPCGLGRRCMRFLRKRRALSQKRVRDEGGEVGNNKEAAFGKGLKPSERRIGIRSGETGDSLEEVGAGEIGNLGLGSGFEAEGMLLELHQIGHWGFGRVSFSGTPCPGVSPGIDG